MLPNSRHGKPKGFITKCGKPPTNIPTLPFSGHTPKASETIKDKSSSGRGPEPEHPLPSLSIVQPTQDPCGKRLAGPSTPWPCPFAHGSSASSQSDCLPMADGCLNLGPGKMGITSGKNNSTLRSAAPSHPVLGHPPCHGLSQRLSCGPQLSMELLLLQARGSWPVASHVLCPICSHRQYWEQGLFAPCLGCLALCGCECSSQRVRMEQQPPARRIHWLL